MKKVRVLSLDGGGIRGIIPATIIQYIEKKLIALTNRPTVRIADYFDFIIGTSTGGILTCFYLTPNLSENGPNARYTATQALEFYSKEGYDIFNASKRRSWFGLASIFNACRYNSSKLESIFRDVFGELKMSDLLKPCVVTTYDLVRQSSFFFSSREDITKQRDFFVKDVARSTSAAPTYFPSATILNLISNKKLINIDGGVFANNPTMCGYAECRNMDFPQAEKPTAAQMLILSIGTGGGRLDLPDIDSSNHWGLVNWGKSIPNIMMDGSIDTVAYQMKKLYGTLSPEDQLNYKRIDVPRDKRNYARDMAEASKGNIDDLLYAGQETLNAALNPKDDEHGLDKFIELLIENDPNY